MEYDLNILMIFVIKEMYNFEPHNVLLAIATNTPVKLSRVSSQRLPKLEKGFNQRRGCITQNIWFFIIEAIYRKIFNNNLIFLCLFSKSNTDA